MTTQENESQEKLVSLCFLFKEIPSSLQVN